MLTAAEFDGLSIIRSQPSVYSWATIKPSSDGHDVYSWPVELNTQALPPELLDVPVPRKTLGLGLYSFFRNA